jgi:hypothetical protein
MAAVSSLLPPPRWPFGVEIEEERAGRVEGGAIQGTNIKAENLGTDLVRKAVSNARGSYLVLLR